MGNDVQDVNNDGLADIVTPGINIGLTEITIGADATAFVGAQSALLTISTVIEFGVPNVEIDKLAVVSDGITTPLFFHTYAGVTPPCTGVAVNTTV